MSHQYKSVPKRKMTSANLTYVSWMRRSSSYFRCCQGRERRARPLDLQGIGYRASRSGIVLSLGRRGVDELSSRIYVSSRLQSLGKGLASLVRTQSKIQDGVFVCNAHGRCNQNLSAPQWNRTTWHSRDNITIIYSANAKLFQ